MQVLAGQARSTSHKDLGPACGTELGTRLLSIIQISAPGVSGPAVVGPVGRVSPCRSVYTAARTGVYGDTQEEHGDTQDKQLSTQEPKILSWECSRIA